MKKTKLLILLAALFSTAIASCTGKEAIEPDEKSDASRIINDETTVIPVEDALEYLNDFLTDTKMVATKSGDARQIASVETHYSETKADIQGSALPDAYLVNFKNDAGFAVLGANTSVDPIIAVIEEGNTDWDAITNPRDEEPSSFEEDCPDPGVKPDQILSACVKNALNNAGHQNAETKTISGPYDKEILPLTDTLKFDQQVTYCHKKNRGYVICGCAATAISIAAAYNNATIFSVDYEKLDLSRCNDKDGEGVFYTAKGYPIYVQYSDYFSNYASIPMTLTTEQRINMIEKIGPGIKAKHAPISVISANSKFRRTQYKLISTVFYKLNNLREKWDYTATMPSAVTNMLKELGYTNVKSTSSTYITSEQRSTIESMLDNNKPVIMCGWSLLDMSNNHYWIIDGLRYKNNQIYYSCNWGWGGYKNGWFSISCLDSDKPITMDVAHTKTTDTQNAYNHLILFSYDLPSEQSEIDCHLLYDRRQKYE